MDDEEGSSPERVRLERLRSVVETVRGELPELIPDQAVRDQVDHDLERALALPDDEAVDAIPEVLRSNAATRGWMRSRADADQDTQRIVGPLGGVLSGGIILLVCPRGDYSEVRESVSDETIFCPHDGDVLRPA